MTARHHTARSKPEVHDRPGRIADPRPDNDEARTGESQDTDPDTGARNDDVNVDLPAAGTDPDQSGASGDEETPDGLNASDEAVRSAAEDAPAPGQPDDSVPVFDRGDLPPKL